MPVRLYSKEHVEAELTRRKCKKLKQLQSASMWRTDGGFWFTVPEEGPDGRCDENTLREILLEISGR
jgi:hypothetical protein